MCVGSIQYLYLLTEVVEVQFTEVWHYMELCHFCQMIISVGCRLRGIGHFVYVSMNFTFLYQV